MPRKLQNRYFSSYSLLILFLLVFSSPSKADVCDYYRKFVPKIYEINCLQGPSKAKKSTGSGASTFGGAFNINPSSVPTEPSPYGLEVIQSVIPPGANKRKISFSIIKGFHKIGSAVSTNSNNTFYGNDIVQRRYGTSEYQTFVPIEPEKGQLPTFNLGTAFEIVKGHSFTSPTVSLGVSLRHNGVTDTFGGGIGLLLKNDVLIIGGGIASEKVSNYLPAVRFYSATLGLRLVLFEVEYTWLKNAGGFALNPIQIVSVTTNLGPMVFTYSVRWLDFYSEGQVSQNHFAIQYSASKHISVGFLHNYIPGSISLAIQAFL